MGKPQNAVINLSKKEQVFLSVGAWLFSAYSRTLRFRWVDEKPPYASDLTQPMITILWHNQLFGAPRFYRRFLRERKVAALISASKDGGWLSGLFERVGIRPIRGSQSRRGASALRELLRASRDGYDIAITPDGSKGPIYKVKHGAVVVAVKTRMPILLVGLNYRRTLRLKTWDRFFVPLPFSRVDIRIDPLGVIDQGDVSIDALAEELERRLRAISTA